MIWRFNKIIIKCHGYYVVEPEQIKEDSVLETKQLTAEKTDGRIICRILSPTFMILCIFLLSGQSSAIESIFKGNQGVNFRALQEISTRNGIWTHTFLIGGIPQWRNFNQLISLQHGIPETEEACWMKRCFQWVEKETEGIIQEPFLNFLRSHPFVRSKSKEGGGSKAHNRPPQEDAQLDQHHSDMCMGNLGIIRKAIEIIKQDRAEIKTLVDAIHDLLPNEILQGKRGRKSWFDLGGRILHGALGVATDQQVKKIEDKVKHMNDLVKTEAFVVKKLGADMQSVSRTVNERMDNLANQITKNSIVTMEKMVNLTHVDNHFHSFRAAMLMRISEISHITSNMQIMCQRYLNGVELLARGNLPPQLINSTVLKSVLSEISNSVSEKGYRITVKNAAEFYRHATFVAGFSAEHLLIHLEIPLSRLATFIAYEIQILSLPVPGHPDSVALLKNEHPGIAIQGKNYFFYLTQEEVFEIKQLSMHETNRRHVRRMNPNYCLIAIVLDDFQKIKDNCEYNIGLNDLKEDIHEIEGNRFLMQNIDNYTLVCDKQTPVFKTGCKLCYIDILNQCSITSRHDTILSTWGNSSGENEHKLVINRPLLSMFFSHSEMKDIKSSSLFISDNIPEFDLPTARFLDFETKAFVASDEKLKLKMHKVADAMKKDQRVISSLSESIIMGQQTIVNTWNYETYILFAVTILVSLLLIQNMLVLAKLRNLGILVALLERNTVKAVEIGEEDSPTKRERIRLYYKKSEEDQKDLADQYETMIKALNAHWIFIFLGTILFVIIVMIIYNKIQKCYDRFNLMRVRTYLAIQFSNGAGNSVVITIQKFDSLVADLSVISDMLPDSFDLKWNMCCQPKMTFIWNAVVFDTFLAKSHQVRQSVKITILEAIQVKKILIQNFTIDLLFKNEGRAHRIQIEQNSSVIARKSIRRNMTKTLKRSTSMINLGRTARDRDRDIEKALHSAK